MPIAAVADEDIWQKAKKAVDPEGKGASKYDDPWAVTMSVYKNMGGKIKGQKEDGLSKNQSGITVGDARCWDHIEKDLFEAFGSATIPKKDALKPAKDPKSVPADGEDEARNLILQNPEMSAPTLLNTMKANGLKIVDAKAGVGEADSGSTMAAPLRAQRQAASMRMLCRLTEAAAAKDGIGVTKFRTVLIQEGLGNLRDAFFYSRQALESAVPLFEGKKIYSDHPSKFDDEVRPERSVKDILGHFENVRLEEAEDGRAMLTADVVTLPDAPYAWARALMRHAVEYSKQFPDKEFVGLSINASGDAEPRDMAEFVRENQIAKSIIPKLQKAMAEGVSEIKVVSVLNEAVSCDLVTEPGAGGKILQMLEQENKMKKESKKKEDEKEKEIGPVLDHKSPGSKPDKIEGEKKEGYEDGDGKDGKDGDDDGADDGHDDADQDKALIKKMLKDHLGDEEEENEAAHRMAKKVYEAYVGMGMDKEAAYEAAGKHMKCAKAMAMQAHKEDEAKKEAEDEAKHAEKKEAAYSMAQLKGENVRLRGEIAKLKESAKKHTLKDYMDEKLKAVAKEAKKGFEFTNQIREAIGQPMSEAHVDSTIKAFMAGYGVKRDDGALDFSDLFVMTEKNTQPGQDEKKSPALDLSDMA